MTNPLIHDPDQEIIRNALVGCKKAHDKMFRLDCCKLLVAKEYGECLLPLKQIDWLMSNREITKLLNQADIEISHTTVDDYIYVATYWDQIVAALGEKLYQTGYKRAIKIAREQAKLLTYVPTNDGWTEEHGGFTRTYPSGRIYVVHPETNDGKRCWMLTGENIPETEGIDAEPCNVPVQYFSTSAAAKAKTDELERLDRHTQPSPDHLVAEQMESATETTHTDDTDLFADLPHKPKEDPALLNHLAIGEAQDAVIKGATEDDPNDKDDEERHEDAAFEQTAKVQHTLQVPTNGTPAPPTFNVTTQPITYFHHDCHSFQINGNSLQCLDQQGQTVTLVAPKQMPDLLRDALVDKPADSQIKERNVYTECHNFQVDCNSLHCLDQHGQTVVLVAPKTQRMGKILKKALVDKHSDAQVRLMDKRDAGEATENKSQQPKKQPKRGHMNERRNRK